MIVSFQWYRIRLLCQPFPHRVSSFTCLGVTPRRRARNFYSGLFQHYNGSQISLQELSRSRTDAFYLQSAAVCQRYDYIERHGHIRDFNLDSPSVAARMAAPGSVCLPYNTEGDAGWNGGGRRWAKIIKSSFPRKGWDDCCLCVVFFFFCECVCVLQSPLRWKKRKWDCELSMPHKKEKSLNLQFHTASPCLWFLGPYAPDKIPNFKRAAGAHPVKRR